MCSRRNDDAKNRRESYYDIAVEAISFFLSFSGCLYLAIVNRWCLYDGCGELFKNRKFYRSFKNSKI